jgi:hypothetical protein
MRYFEEFIAFYFPDTHRQIDWQKGYQFLDQELAQVVQDQNSVNAWSTNWCKYPR